MERKIGLRVDGKVDVWEGLRDNERSSGIPELLTQDKRVFV